MRDLFVSYASPVDSLELIFNSNFFDLVKLIPLENYKIALNKSPDLMIRFLSNYLPQISELEMPDDTEGYKLVYNT